MANEWRCGQWRFVLSEESAGHWRVTGTHALGPSVQHDGGSEVELLKDALVSALAVEKSLKGTSSSLDALEKTLQETRRMAPDHVDRFANGVDEIQEALFVYLGATPESPGYQVLGDHDGFLKARFPQKGASLKGDIDLVLKRVETIGWNRSWTPSMAEEMHRKISEVYPWLSPAARESLINAFSYWYK